jgi:hypothetical protein
MRVARDEEDRCSGPAMRGAGQIARYCTVISVPGCVVNPCELVAWIM